LTFPSRRTCVASWGTSRLVWCSGGRWP
jgi:hypothetical protein